MKTNIVHKGSALDVIKEFPDESINSVITSPPYWQLRDYGWDGQWGLEPTFEMYLENLWSLMDEIHRVLKKDGTVWINLGDTYGTQSGGLKSESTFGPKNPKATINVIKQPKTIHKSLLLLPHRFAIGCIERGWIIRNDIVWAKRNAMPESVTDRFSKKHEYFFFMTKSSKYYFDLDRIRDNHKWASRDKRSLIKGGVRHKSGKSINGQYANDGTSYNELGKNPGSVSDFWDIPTKPNKKNHYATYNESLILKPILAGCPAGGIILDPFCGVATTGLSVIKRNRLFIGVEGNEDWAKQSNDLIKNELNQVKLF